EVAQLCGRPRVDAVAGAGEQVEETFHQARAGLQRGGGEAAQPAQLAEQLVRFSGQGRDTGQVSAGGQVGQVGQVLAAQDLHRGGETARGRDAPGDHVAGLLQVVLLAGAPVDDGEHKGVAAAAPGPAGPLDVVGGPVRQGSEDDGGQVT